MRSDPFLIAVAQVQGAVSLHCQPHGSEPGPAAVADVLAIVNGQPAAKRQRVLDEAASRYVEPGEFTGWFVRALALLVEAGADAARARELHAARPKVRGLGGLGEGGGPDRDQR